MNIAVYIPAPRTYLARFVKVGSGMVGSPEPDHKIRLDFEGAIYGQSTLQTYADRIDQAVGRHVTHYPTIARAWADPNEVIQIGTWDTDARTLAISDMAILEAWLGITPVPPRELTLSPLR